MARGLYAFLGGALGRAREVGQAYQGAYSGMLTQLKEEEERRLREEELQRRIAADEADAARYAAKDAADKEEAATKADIAGRKSKLTAKALARAGELKGPIPLEEQAPMVAEFGSDIDLGDLYTHGIFAKGAPDKPVAPPKPKDPTDAASAELLLEKRKADVGAIPAEGRQRALREQGLWEDRALRRWPGGVVPVGHDVLEKLLPWEKAQYDRLTEEIQSGRAQSTMTPTGSDAGEAEYTFTPGRGLERVGNAPR